MPPFLRVAAIAKIAHISPHLPQVSPPHFSSHLCRLTFSDAAHSSPMRTTYSTRNSLFTYKARTPHPYPPFLSSFSMHATYLYTPCSLLTAATPPPGAAQATQEGKTGVLGNRYRLGGGLAGRRRTRAAHPPGQA